MKPKIISSVLLAAIFLAGSLGRLRADDWKTIDGKVYQDVKVIHSDADAVTILHKDGGALVPLELLPDDLQKRFNYDPKKARAAADDRMRQEFQDARAMRQERAQAENQRRTETEEEAAQANESAANDSGSASTPPVVSSGTHHFMDEITGSAQTMHRDFSDPTYHTMAHLVTTVHSLGPDPTDPNHHSIGEITNPSP